MPTPGTLPAYTSAFDDGIGGSTRVSAANPMPMTGSLTVDSEFPAAAALGDASPNPTTTVIGGYTFVFNGTTWDRARGDIANGLDVDVTRLPALVAGAAIIGKVGIDQTTPGTTDSVSVKSGAYAASAATTRTNDTNAYLAGDVIGSATSSAGAVLTFSLIGPSAGARDPRPRRRERQRDLLQLRRHPPARCRHDHWISVLENTVGDRSGVTLPAGPPVGGNPMALMGVGN